MDIKIKNALDECIKNSGVSVTAAMLENSVFNRGNLFSLQNVIKKAVFGNTIKICGFGGSITEGVGKNSPPPAESGIADNLSGKNYFDNVCDFFESAFPCNVIRINSGISATDTVFAIHRMYEDVISHKPDLTILEWCCNDGIEFPYKQATYEYMLREILKSGSAVIMLSMSDRNGNSSQALHEPLSKLYDVPMVSFRDAYFGNTEYPYYISDSVHPNKVGHMLAAILINAFIANAYNNISKSCYCEKNVLPKPLNNECNYYKSPKILNLRDIYDKKTENAKILSLGSFKFEKDEYTFGFRSYDCLSSVVSSSYSPLIIEINSIRTLFLYICRNTINFGSDFAVQINGKQINSNTFTCMHGTDNNQTEWSYAWATDKILFSNVDTDVVLKILPTPKNNDAKIKLFSLLIS